MQEVLIIAVAVGVFLLFLGLAAPASRKTDAFQPAANQSEFRPRSIGRSKTLTVIAGAGVRRALSTDKTNEKYLRQLKQANWFWEKGEPAMPNPKAPFWNLESMWGEKFFGAFFYGGMVAVFILISGIVLSLSGKTNVLIVAIAAAVLGGAVSFFAFQMPDEALASAAGRRQRMLSLEMGYRIPELRSDVLSGNTVQRAIRNMARRPGGPFVEELRRAVAVLDITKDDIAAMDGLIERNEGNELLAEFANNLKMVSRQGGQISPVLNVLADLAQQRLRLSIQGQARRNLQEMTRPIGISSLMVTTLLIIVPAIVGVLGHIAG
ncbi:MAG TPA: type II secretion system F family protein [Anaerolineae bacterium]